MAKDEDRIWAMNSQKKYFARQYLLNSSIQTNAGFTMPIALGIGLTMMLVTATMMTNSQSDRQTTYSHRESNRALNVAETGATRFRAFLDRHKFLANRNLENWLDTLNNLPFDRANCNNIDLNSAKQQANLYNQKQWLNIDDRDLDKGRYQIVNYQYQNGIGKVTIAGEVGVTGNTRERTAVNTIAVEIPIGSNAIAPPALWVNTLILSNERQIKGDVRTTICPIVTREDLDGISGVNITNLLPISDRLGGEIIGDAFTSLPQIKNPPNNATLIPAITTSIELPRPDSTDTPDVNGEYHYLVDVDSPDSGYSIKLKDGDAIDISITSDKKVNLYLKGNIDFAGAKTNNVSYSHPNLRIYGGNYTKKIIVKDSASITALIHAPVASGKSIPNEMMGMGITGGIWVNNWDSQSNRSKLKISQAGAWEDWGIKSEERPPQLNPIHYWRRTNL
jgi:hypothetical protein